MTISDPRPKKDRIPLDLRSSASFYWIRIECNALSMKVAIVVPAYRTGIE